jgi:hypothetical protein
VNGDGFDDIIIGASEADPTGDYSGAAYVIFGRATGFPGTLNLASLNGANGFKIPGEGAYDGVGYSVGAAGDINGDNFDDIVITAGAIGPSADSPAVYVVFGKGTPFTTPFNLAALDGTNGFKIPARGGDTFFGQTVEGAGDINGDGFDDLILSVLGNYADGNSKGQAYVIFGKATAFTTPFNVATLNGGDGFAIRNDAGLSRCYSASGAGDINGDGFDDLIVGISEFTYTTPSSAASYVIFGSAGGFVATFNLSTINGTNGFELRGRGATGPIDTNGLFNLSISGPGDFNGDGFDDLLIGEVRLVNDNQQGVASVVFGKGTAFTTPIKLASLGAGEGLEIAGLDSRSALGNSVSGAGDVNNDGFADLLIGAPPSNRANVRPGEVYVIFGRAGLEPNANSVVVTEPDGDIVTIKFPKGGITGFDITRAADGSIDTIDIQQGGGAAPGLKALNFTVTVKPAKGGASDGIGKIGLIKALQSDIGTMKIEGDVGAIEAGTGSGKMALKRLVLQGSLGQLPGQPLRNTEIAGNAGSVVIKGDVHDTALMFTGNVQSLTIGGEFTGAGALALDAAAEIAANGVGTNGGLLEGILGIGGKVGKLTLKKSITGATFVAGGAVGEVVVAGSLQEALFFADAGIRKMTIGANLASADAAAPSVISARGRLDSLLVKGDVQNAQILAGYTKDGDPVNADAFIGRVTVQGNWSTSSLVAGISDSTADGFGRNDTIISGDTTEDVFSRIASVVIKGTASGSAAMGDHFGITAQKIGSVTIGGVKVGLSKEVADDVLVEGTDDFRIVEVVGG